MTKKLTLISFSCLIFLCFSCKRQKNTSGDHSKTISDYEQLIDHAEKNEQNQLEGKLEELGADDKFHLQKLAKLQHESSAVNAITNFLEAQKYDEAELALNEHIRQHGISPALEELRATAKTLKKFKNLRLQAEQGELSKNELIQLQKELQLIFPKSKKLKTAKMTTWFQQQHKLIQLKANQRLDKLRTVNLIQLDQINTELDLQSKAGAEIYYRELSKHKKPSTSHNVLQKSIINFSVSSDKHPVSLSEAVLQLYKRSSKQAIANTMIDLNELEKDTHIAQSLKDRILRSALSAKNIQLDKSSSSPLLNLPTLMEIIIKSEE